MTREQLRAAKTAVDAGNNGAENNGLENVGERLQRLESMMRILLEENYQWSPQQRQQSVVDRTQPLQATDWDTEQQSSGGRGTPREHRSSEGGGAQVLLDLGNRDKQPWTDGGMLWGAGTGPQWDKHRRDMECEKEIQTRLEVGRGEALVGEDVRMVGEHRGEALHERAPEDVLPDSWMMAGASLVGGGGRSRCKGENTQTTASTNRPRAVSFSEPTTQLSLQDPSFQQAGVNKGVQGGIPPQRCFPGSRDGCSACVPSPTTEVCHP